MPELRLLSLTSHAGGWDAAARTIAEAEVDVACLHGAPSLLRWRSTCAAIARRAGLVTVVGGRTSGGALLLSTLGVDVTATHEVSFGRGVRPPGAGVARMALRGSRFVFAGACVPPGAGELLGNAVRDIDPDFPPAVLALSDPDAPAPWPGLTDAPGGVFVESNLEVTESVRLPGGVRVVVRLPD